MIMAFEFDPKMSLANLDKHGVDFDDAQQLWLDEYLLEIPANNTDEPRSLFIGMIAGKHWSAITTYRDRKIRLISVRRSRHKEIEVYES